MAEQGLEGNQPVDLLKHPSGIVPTLQNIVSTVNLDCKLEYNPKRFAAVIMRIREPKTTALIFASGKMVCTGAKSEHLSKLAARKYARIVQKLGFPAKFKILQQMRNNAALFALEEGSSHVHNPSTAAEDSRLASLISLDAILKQVKEISRQASVHGLSKSKKKALLESLDELNVRMT